MSCRLSRRAAISACLILVFSLGLRAERAEVVIAAQTFADFSYEGDASTPATERLSFALGEGKYNVGGPEDASLDAVAYDQVARRLTIELSRHGYALARDPARADLLILVHRGCTNPVADRENAAYDLDEGGPGALLSGGGLSTAAGNLPAVGYTSGAGADVAIAEGNLKTIAAGLGWKARLDELEYMLGNVATDYRYEDMVRALAKPRYYIVLEAFDMKHWQASGERRLLWRSSLSFRADNRTFDDRYEATIKAAARYFGRRTPKELARTWVDVPDKP